MQHKLLLVSVTFHVMKICIDVAMVTESDNYTPLIHMRSCITLDYQLSLTVFISSSTIH